MRNFAQACGMHVEFSSFFHFKHGSSPSLRRKQGRLFVATGCCWRSAGGVPLAGSGDGGGEPVQRQRGLQINAINSHSLNFFSFSTQKTFGKMYQPCFNVPHFRISP